MRNHASQLFLWFLAASLLVTVAACQRPAPEASSPVKLLFVRDGLAIEGSVDQAEVFRDGQRVSSTRIDMDGRRQLLKFAWKPGEPLKVVVLSTPHEVIAPLKPSPYQIRTIPLETVDAAAATTAIPDSTVKLSPDGSRLAIGTLYGNLQVTDVFRGNTLWKKKLAEGMIKRVDFSPDGATVYAGEQSPDGFVYALDARTGEVRWKMRLADELEASRPPAAGDRYGVYFLPGVFQMRVAPDGRVMVAGTHSWNDNGVQKNRARLYVIAPDGTSIWKYPEDGPMDANITAFDMDHDGRRLVFATSRSATTPPKGPITGPGVFALDMVSRKATWHETFTPLAPYFKDVFIWQAVGMTPDGARAVAGLGDGRAVLFDAAAPGPEAKVLKTLELGTPVVVSGVPIATPVAYAMATSSALYLQTNDSNIPAGTEATSRTAPAPHPSARTLFALDREGGNLWRYQADFTPAGLWSSSDGRLVLETTANPHNETRTDKHGFVLLDTSREGSAEDRIVYAYQTAGPVFFYADLSADGFTAAVTETPAMKEDGHTMYGTYQVHLVH